MSGKRAKRLRREESDGEDEPRARLTRAEARALFKRADAIGEFIAADPGFNNALAVMDDIFEQDLECREPEASAVLAELSDEAGALAAIDSLRDNAAADGYVRAAAARAAALAVRADAVAQGYPPAQAALYAVAYVKAAMPEIDEWMGTMPIPEEIPAAYADEFACSPFGQTYAAVYTERVVAGDGLSDASQAAREAANKASHAQSEEEFDAMLVAYGRHLETRPHIFWPALFRRPAPEESGEWA